MTRELLLVGMAMFLTRCQIWEQITESKEKNVALPPSIAYEQHIKKIVDQ